LNENPENSKLRPESLNDYIGQGHIKKQLKLILDSAQMRSKMPEHILFYGPPVLGKTTLAQIISKELEANFKAINAPTIQKTGDIVSSLVSLEPKTVFFIDEIHRLKTAMEESLYTAMEDFQVDLLMGKGQGANIMRLDIEPFTLVGATTHLGKISKPLKDRFTSIFQLQPYNLDELLELLERNTTILRIYLEDRAKLLICRRSRGVPRVLNNILKRLHDYVTVHKIDLLDEFETKEFLEQIGIYDLGLTKADIKYLKAIANQTLGLKTLGGVLLEETETIEYSIEPYLIHLGFVDKNSLGRRLTLAGQEYLDKHL